MTSSTEETEQPLQEFGEDSGREGGHRERLRIQVRNQRSQIWFHGLAGDES